MNACVKVVQECGTKNSSKLAVSTKVLPTEPLVAVVVGARLLAFVHYYDQSLVRSLFI